MPDWDSEAKRLEILLEHLAAVLWTTDRKLRFTSSQGAGLARLGLEEGQVAGMPLSEYLETEDPDHPILVHHRRALEGETREFGTKMADRHFRCVVEPLRNDSNAVVGVIGLALDVTEEVQAETGRQALLERERQAREDAEEAQRRFQGLVDHLEAIVWEATPEFQFTFVSRWAEILLGYPVEDWLEPGFWESILHPEDRKEAVAFCRDATARGEDHHFEYRAVTREGDVLHLRDLVHVVTGEGGAPELLHGVMLDVTDQKLREIELRGLNEVLTAQQAELSTYHDILTHDLSNLSMTLLGLIERVLAEIPSNQLLQRARRQAFELHRLAENAKLLVRLRDCGMPETTRPLVLDEVVRRSIDLVQSVHFDREIDPAVECPEDLAASDLPFLENVLTNLLDNAIRHTPLGERPHLRITATTDDGWIRLGIVGGRPAEKEEPARLLERYARGEGSRGSGLGLALAQEVIERAGGRIEVDAIEGPGGPLFRVTLFVAGG